MKSLISKILNGLVLVLAVVVLNFVLIHAAPGDSSLRSMRGSPLV